MRVTWLWAPADDGPTIAQSRSGARRTSFSTLNSSSENDTREAFNDEGNRNHV